MLGINVKTVDKAMVIAETMKEQAVAAMYISFYYDMLAAALSLFGDERVEMTWKWDVNLYDNTYTMFDLKGYRRSEEYGMEDRLEEMPLLPEGLDDDDDDHDPASYVHMVINDIFVSRNWAYNEGIDTWTLEGDNL